MRYAFTIDLTEEEFAELPILVQRAADLYRNSPEHVKARAQCQLLGALAGLLQKMLLNVEEK